MVKYISNLEYFDVWRVYNDAIQYLEPFPLLWAAALRFAFAGRVVKLRMVVFPSCDVYKDYIFVYDFVLTLLLVFIR